MWKRFVVLSCSLSWDQTVATSCCNYNVKRGMCLRFTAHCLNAARKYMSYRNKFAFQFKKYSVQLVWGERKINIAGNPYVDTLRLVPLFWPNQERKWLTTDLQAGVSILCEATARGVQGLRSVLMVTSSHIYSTFSDCHSRNSRARDQIRLKRLQWKQRKADFLLPAKLLLANCFIPSWVSVLPKDHALLFVFVHLLRAAFCKCFTIHQSTFWLQLSLATKETGDNPQESLWGKDKTAGGQHCTCRWFWNSGSEWWDASISFSHFWGGG